MRQIVAPPWGMTNSQEGLSDVQLIWIIPSSLRAKCLVENYEVGDLVEKHW